MAVALRSMWQDQNARMADSAQAKELIKAQSKRVEPPRDAFGHIVPSEESLGEVNQNHIVSDEVPPKHKPEL